MRTQTYDFKLNAEYDLKATVSMTYNEKYEVVKFSHMVENSTQLIEVVSKPIKPKLILNAARAVKKLRKAEKEFHRQLRAIYPETIILHKLHYQYDYSEGRK